MANQRVTDLDPIVTLPDSGIIHVVDTTNNAQDAAGSSFKITKANLLKENTAAILLNTVKVGITPTQTTAITNNTNKVGYTDALVAAAPTVVANTAKVGITTTQATAITTNSSKVGYTENLVLSSAALALKADLEVGKNKYNYLASDAISGFFLLANGNQSVNSNYAITGYIPIVVGRSYFCNIFNYPGGAYYVFYDINKVFISSSNTLGTVAPANAFYLRYSINSSTLLATVQVEEGNVGTAYEAYKQLVKLNQIPILEAQSIRDNVVSTLKIQNAAVIENKTVFFDQTVNLFNPAEVTFGFFVLSTNGVLNANASYNASGFIPVTAGLNYALSFKHQIAWYNVNKVYIVGSSSADTNKVQLAPAEAAFLRCSIHVASYSTFQVEVGTVQSTYIPFNTVLKEPYIKKYFNKLESIIGRNAKIFTQASLTTGNIIELTDFPYHIKKGLSMSIYTDLTLSGEISYGKGYGKFTGEYFTIDNTNVYYYNNSVLTTTKAHGLTISTFLKSSFSTDDNSIATFIVQSLGGYFKTTFQMANEMNYEPFIRTNGQTINNIKLTAGSKDFQKPVWAFGDSYFGLGASRWVGTMKTFGYFNFLINGLSGQVSTAAYTDLLRCLNYGEPKYILWCLGMNDTNSDYIATLNSLIATCNARNITLILGVTPTVPTRDKEVLRTTVLNSGYRFIDFYKAVGTNSAGNWYTGYLNADGIHPNQIGADALSTQVLIDFPELMQYGKNL